jgi:hypothetical protein
MSNLNSLTDTELEVLFRSWWSDSYSAVPPGAHALVTHLGWARYLLSELNKPDANA